jgi:hypothetical protein
VIVRADPHDLLVHPNGAPTGSKDLWEELPKQEAAFNPLIERIRFLVVHGLSSMMVLSDYWSRCIAPL